MAPNNKEKMVLRGRRRARQKNNLAASSASAPLAGSKFGSRTTTTKQKRQQLPQPQRGRGRGGGEASSSPPPRLRWRRRSERKRRQPEKDVPAGGGGGSSSSSSSSNSSNSSNSKKKTKATTAATAAARKREEINAVKTTWSAKMSTTAPSTPPPKSLAMRGGGGSSGYLKKSTVVATPLGLPSPSGSTSETSDYQRSTPSPREEQTGVPLEEWPQESRGGHGGISCNGGANDSSSDAGFSEETTSPPRKASPPLPPPPPPPPASASGTGGSLTARLRCVRRRRSTPGGAAEVVVDPGVMLQRVQMALNKAEKAAAAAAPTPSQVEAAADVAEAASPSLKRRHSEDATSGAVNNNSPDVPDLKRKKLMETPASSHKSSPELSRCHFSACRKEALDRVLNLKSESNDDQKLVTDSQEEAEVKRLVNADCHRNDLFLLSQLKQQLQQQQHPNQDLSKVKRNLSTEEDFYQNKTTITNIRFPAPSPASCPTPPNSDSPSEATSSSASSLLRCKWEGCEEELQSSAKLMDHLKVMHTSVLNPECSEDFVYRCLWSGCRVYGKGSTSRRWLEQHAADKHGGAAKHPFACIVDGCKMRFGTRSLLERHVNSHFMSSVMASTGTSVSEEAQAGNASANADEAAPLATTSSSSSSSSATARLMRKMVVGGRRLKFRKTIYSARIFDLFDVGVMARVRERLSRAEAHCASERVEQWNDNSAAEIRLKGEVLAKRKSEDGAVMVLQRWTPENIIGDTWTPLKSAQSTRTLKLSSLSLDSKMAYTASLFGFAPPEQARRPRKNRQPLPSHERLS